MQVSSTAISTIVNVSKKIKDDRSLDKILMHAVTELGELSEEVLIEKGLSYKNPGVDGVVGEAVDLIICVVDLLYIHLKQNGVDLSGDVIDAYIKDVAEAKLKKWEEKIELIKNKNCKTSV